MRNPLLVKLVGNIFQKPTDFQMLGTNAFAGTAFQTILGSGTFLGADVVVVIFRVPVVKDPLGIQQSEQIGNSDALGADLGAVAAGGAGISSCLMPRTSI